MKNKYLALVILASGLLFTGCKDDEESDILPDTSEVTGLFINEIYSSNPDWIELYNSTDKEINLGGFSLQDDKGAAEGYQFATGTKLAAKSYLVLNETTDFTFGISSSKGDEITLLDSRNATIDNVSIPVMEDGKSYARKTDGGSEWQKLDKPTKGKDNTAAGDTEETPEQSKLPLFINEVMSAPAGEDTDFIEIYNAGDAEIDMSGFALQDDKGAAEQFVIPSGIKIPAKGILVFSQVSPGAGESFTFGLSSKGDKVILLDATGKQIDKVETPDYGDTKGSSYARIGDGGAQWQIIDVPTKGQPNATTTSTPLKGNLVLNEIYTFSDQASVNDLDYIELYNKSNQRIELGGLKMWESGGREEVWTFPQGKYIEANGRLVIECDKEGFHSDPANYPAWGLSKGPDEYIVIADAGLNLIDSIACPSLKRNESYGRTTDGGAQWQIFAQYTRGTANSGEARQPVTNSIGLWINEVFTNNQDAQQQTWDDSKDFIELYNSSATEIQLEGYRMNDDAQDPEKEYVFPAGSVVPAHGFLTLDAIKKNPNGPVFGLGKGGDWVFIYNPQGNLIAEIETPAFADDEIYSVGRKTDGGNEIVIFTEVSKNGSNNGKAVKK